MTLMRRDAEKIKEGVSLTLTLLNYLLTHSCEASSDVAEKFSCSVEIVNLIKDQSELLSIGAQKSV